MAIPTKNEIKQLLLENDRAVERALVLLFRRQTQTEQQVEEALVLNDRGFNKADAKKFSSFARQVLRGRPLSPKQLYYLRVRPSGHNTRIGKYAGQLVEEARRKAARGT